MEHFNAVLIRMGKWNVFLLVTNSPDLKLLKSSTEKSRHSSRNKHSFSNLSTFRNKPGVNKFPFWEVKCIPFNFITSTKLFPENLLHNFVFRAGKMIDNKILKSDFLSTHDVPAKCSFCTIIWFLLAFLLLFLILMCFFTIVEKSDFESPLGIIYTKMPHK